MQDVNVGATDADTADVNDTSLAPGCGMPGRISSDCGALTRTSSMNTPAKYTSRQLPMANVKLVRDQRPPDEPIEAERAGDNWTSVSALLAWRRAIPKSRSCQSGSGPISAVLDPAPNVQLWSAVWGRGSIRNDTGSFRILAHEKLNKTKDLNMPSGPAIIVVYQ
ncbi:hypothetical protein [Mesorhizobium sp. M7A.F.Ca.US.011.01.1.1]|uniref:hypothetical protein n=1 Tax=Mesorhizobium sp. M7A.F.Ca.US.011.01.1.1 TaxID=2496741 RepID=UPI0013E3ECD5|nr:hypothetical protein [Mesorhizobium sp. M7A.F.Ca.US.011.01.1.1]